MKIKTKLLFIGATIALATPMLFTSRGAAAVGIEYDNQTQQFFFTSHSDEFLNSPHARFSAATGFDSDFQDEITGNNLGCTGCHDPALTAAADNVITRCGVECHFPGDGTAPAAIGYGGFHDGFGAPAPDTETADGRGTNPDACVACHMGAARPHLFRINTDSLYSPFPDDIAATTAVPNNETYGENNQTFTEAVWLSVTEACLHCHDDGVAFPLTKAEAASFAMGYHNVDFSGSQTHDNYFTRFNWYTGSGCYEVDVDGSDNQLDCEWVIPAEASIDKPNDCIATITFAGKGTYPVTLKTNHGAGQRTMYVKAYGNNILPAAGFSVGSDGLKVTVTDQSTISSCGHDAGDNTVIFLWGDGTTDTIGHTALGQSLTMDHFYLQPGTYTIRYSVRDSNLNKAMAEQVTITVPAAEDLLTIAGLIREETNGRCSLPNYPNQAVCERVGDCKWGPDVSPQDGYVDGLTADDCLDSIRNNIWIPRPTANIGTWTSAVTEGVENVTVYISIKAGDGDSIKIITKTSDYQTDIDGDGEPDNEKGYYSAKLPATKLIRQDDGTYEAEPITYTVKPVKAGYKIVADDDSGHETQTVSASDAAVNFTARSLW